MTFKTISKRIALPVLAFVSATAWSLPVLASAAPNLFFNPSATQVTEGQMVTVQVREDSGTVPVNAVQANISYPADKLEMKYINVVGSEFQITAEQTTTEGSVRLARGRQGAPLTGSRQIAQITFVAKSAGTAEIDYTAGSVVVNSTDNSNVNAALDSAAVTILPKSGASTAPVSTVSPTPAVTPAATPTVLPEAGSDTPTTLPETGAMAMAGMAGLGTIGATSLVYIRSRRDLKQTLRHK